MSTDRLSHESNVSALSRISDFQACYYAHELTRMGTVGELERLGSTLYVAHVDLNSHMIEVSPPTKHRRKGNTCMTASASEHCPGSEAIKPSGNYFGHLTFLAILLKFFYCNTLHIIIALFGIALPRLTNNIAASYDTIGDITQ